jgi:SAM-dependent methyltransferase
MEEVATHVVLAEAVRKLQLRGGQPLRVLDLGCGIGDGFDLLTEAHGGMSPASGGHPVDYVGLDADADMIATAKSVHTDHGVSFHVGDMRGQLPDQDFDLYLSCGVPYSHLTVEECEDVIAEIMTRVAETRRRAALVVDVLGRFSIEWVPKWGETRWDYAMTFFEDTSERLEQPMTFFDRASLEDVIMAASARAGIWPVDVLFNDRSILTGRHTTTKAFNSSIPPYRTLVNDLGRGSLDVTLADLRFDPPVHGAPSGILAFFEIFSARWNMAVGQAQRDRDGRPVREVDATALASALMQCERQEQRGLGVGHSLTATVVIDAS